MKIKAPRYEVFGRFLDRCESPIERLFLVGLLFMGDYTFEPFEHDHVIARDSMGIELWQQFRMHPYRIDFTLTRPGQRERFAIEIDGYVHHGAHPDQFERDSRRQREIASRGWTVIRLAGSEITRDPRFFAAQTMGIATGKLVSPNEDVSPLPPAPKSTTLSYPVDPKMAALGRRADEVSDWNEKIRLLGDAAEIARSRVFPGRKAAE